MAPQDEYHQERQASERLTLRLIVGYACLMAAGIFGFIYDYARFFQPD